MEGEGKIGELMPAQVKMEALEPREYQLMSGRLLVTGPDLSCIVSQLDEGKDLCESTLMQGLTSQDVDYVEDAHAVNSDIEQENSMDSTDNVLVQLMDIRTSLSSLRSMLEQRLGTDLTDYEFWLQNSKKLESHKTLVDQCIKGEGIVQVNIQIRVPGRRINIVDVLKPDEDYMDVADEESLSFPIGIETAGPLVSLQDGTENRDEGDGDGDGDVDGDGDGDTEEEGEGRRGGLMVRWAVDAQFKADQLRLNIPEDPKFWTVPQVRHWIQWAVRQFNLTGIKLSDWSITGNELCALTLEDFKAKCPSDPVDLFWTHLELLRKCKFIAVVQNEESTKSAKEVESSNQNPSAIRKRPKVPPVMMEGKGASSPSVTLMSAALNRSGNNGQIQLWQFLLELLTSTAHTDVIQWIGSNGEFKLQEPEMVAKLWGLRKHKPTMNYEKLSRALRYYYDGDMISKVHGKRFVYRFVCDLKQLIGYDAGDLSRLVNRGQENTPLDESNSFDLYG